MNGFQQNKQTYTYRTIYKTSSTSLLMT